MKKSTRNLLVSILCFGVSATALCGVTVAASASAESVRVKPTGTNVNTLNGPLADSMLDSFQIYGASTRLTTPNGFRFLATIENDDLALIPQGAEFGTILIFNSIPSSDSFIILFEKPLHIRV